MKARQAATADAAVETKAGGAAPVLRGAGILRELRAAKIDFVLAVPDMFTSDGFLRPLTEAQADPQEQLRLVRLAREDEGIGVAAGLSYCDRRAVLSMQYTGFMDSINALRATTLDYNLPLVMQIGLLAHKPPEAHPRHSLRAGVRDVVTILEGMGIAYHCLHDDSHLPLIRPAIDMAYDTAKPVALLIARIPVAS